jgi:cell wall-associated NlpC family hydrolase
MSRRSAAVVDADPPTELEMPSAVDPRRLVVIDEARGWLRTPYHHMGRVKGAGTDCLMLLAEVYESAKVVPHIEVPFYPPDWNLHRDAERYLLGVMRYAREIPEPPQPGDVAVFKFGRCFAHGAIAVAWPCLIHAWHSTGVVHVDATQPPLAGRRVRFFDPFVTI